MSYIYGPEGNNTPVGNHHNQMSVILAKLNKNKKIIGVFNLRYATQKRY